MPNTTKQCFIKIFANLRARLLKRIDGWPALLALNALIFGPHLNANIYHGFELDKAVALLCIAATASWLLSRLTYLIVIIVLVIVNVVYMHILNHWGVFGIVDRITVALESPSREAIEYLTTYSNKTDAMIVIYAGVCALLTWLVSRPKQPSSWGCRLLSPLPVIFVATLMLNNTRTTALPIVQIPLELYNLPIRVAQLEARNNAIAAARTYAINCKAHYENVVVVIGESASYEHNPLYGYKANWRSQLEDLDMVKINAISPANMTRISIPLMLTAARAGEPNAFYRSASLVSDMKACGYQTYWVSNQHQTGAHDDIITSIAKEADISIFIAKDAVGYGFDGELVEKINLLKSHPGKKAFFVHLMGSHAAYDLRFPKDFSNTSDDLIKNYDTSIHYTDTVLRTIFDAFSRDSLLFVYCADHADTFVTKGKFGHGFNPAYKQEYHIPFLLWASNTDRIAALKSAMAGKIVNTESLDDVMRYLVGITDDMNISFSKNVAVASPTRIRSYDDLQTNVEPKLNTPTATYSPLK